MTPLAVEMLLWFHTRAAEAGPFPGIERGPQNEIVRWFIAEGVIVPHDATSSHRLYTTTDRGAAWVSLILDTPMPVKLWADPRKAA